MSTTTNNDDVRLNFRLPARLKRIIEQAAAQTGQTVSAFAVATLVQTARQVIEESSQTDLTDRDRSLFVAMLDDVDAKPNKALAAAARSYKKKIG